MQLNKFLISGTVDSFGVVKATDFNKQCVFQVVQRARNPMAMEQEKVQYFKFTLFLGDAKYTQMLDLAREGTEVSIEGEITGQISRKTDAQGREMVYHFTNLVPHTIYFVEQGQALQIKSFYTPSQPAFGTSRTPPSPKQNGGGDSATYHGQTSTGTSEIPF